MQLPFTLLAYLSTALASAEPINQALLWGPYRPNLYFGVRPRIPTGPIFGLMWGAIKNGKLDPRNLRHSYEQSDGLARYGWTTYDARSGGVQEISDPDSGLNLTLQYVRFPNRWGDWSVRVNGVLVDDLQTRNITVVFYLGAESPGASNSSGIECTVSSSRAVNCLGDAIGVGQYSTLMPAPEITSLHPTILKSTAVASDRLWEAKDIFVQNDVWPSNFPENQTSFGNLHYVQRYYDTSFKFDIHFTSDPISKPLDPEDLTSSILDLSSSFSTRFASVFQPSLSYTGRRYSEFSQSLLSNLLGGIGYFYGDTRIEQSATAPLKSPNDSISELFTAVPSRAFFPRGFLWDEGFHLLVIINWDIDLALEILQSWFALMDQDGWIAREQILGPEARSKVPVKFQVQNPEFANPPTLFLVVEYFLDFVSGKSSYRGAKSAHLEANAATAFLKQLYPKLKRHYEWFKRTQREDGTHLEHSGDGDVYRGYRWRGQTTTHILTSGLDDYPRATSPSTRDLHVDALSWVGLMTEVLRKVSVFLEETEDTKVFGQEKDAVDRSIELLHWSNADQAYCDSTVESKRRIYVCHKGYISVFPLLLGSLKANHPHLNATLNLMRDEAQMWSPFGLRSLSQSDPLYGTGENYWRGPIWININYIALLKLLELAKTEGPCRHTAYEMYTHLRSNIISTVYKSWSYTGFAWEQYDPETGAGQRTQGFTGWTALLVNIMALPELDNAMDSDDVPDDSNPNHLRKESTTAVQVFLLVVMLAAVFVLRKRIYGCFGWRRRRRSSSIGLGRYSRITAS